MKEYLKQSVIIDFSHPRVQKLAQSLSMDCSLDVEIAKKCFLYVRDEIHHSGDYKDNITTCKASEVLEYKTGWCYAKSHLLAALLRANNIPTAFCYQRLSCGEYQDSIYCLHGLNAIYLKEYGWYKVDARGNKEGVNAEFIPPIEQLAFKLQENEYDLAEYFAEPLNEVVKMLQKNKTYDEMINHFPNVSEYIREATTQDSDELSALSNGVLDFIFEKSAPTWFVDELSSQAFKERIQSENYEHFVYIADEKIVGVIAIKDKNQIFSLFVDANYHKRGIAKKLWEFTKTAYKVENMKVNASLYAIKVYESFGFVKVDEEKCFQELKYQPMIYKG